MPFNCCRDSHPEIIEAFKMLSNPTFCKAHLSHLKTKGSMGSMEAVC